MDQIVLLKEPNDSKWIKWQAQMNQIMHLVESFDQFKGVIKNIVYT